METKIRLKNLYLIAIITIGLIGLGLGSTFAMFTAETTINNPIAFNSNLTSTNVLAETIEVIVPAEADKNVDIVISNTNANPLNYNVWYTPTSNDLEVGSESTNNSYGPVGVLPSSGNFTLTVGLRNNGDSPITVTIGVSSSGDTIVLPSGVTSVPNSALPYRLSLSDFIYVLGSNQSTVSSLSANFYDQSNQTISEQNNVTLPASISIAQNEVLLVRYIGSVTEVNIPNTFIKNGNTYNVVLLSYVNDGSNLSTGVFYKNDDIEDISFGNNVKYIALNSSGNGYDNYSMNNMFNGCTSLETVSNIPNTITNMDSTFTGCTSIVTAPTLSSGVTNISNLFSGCTSLTTLNLSNIDLDDVTSYTNALTGVSTTATITVPNCTQYRLFVSKIGTSYTGLSATDSDYTCYYQQVEFIQSTGTQYIDTGVKGTSNLKSIAEINITSLPSAGTPFFGGYGNSQRCYLLIVQSDGTVGISYISTTNSSRKLSTNTIYMIETDFTKGSQMLKVDNESVLTGANNNTLNTNVNILLFGYYFNTGLDTRYPVNMKLYSFKLYSSGTLIRDYIPCYTIVPGKNSKGVNCSAGTRGLYDKVNNVFYSNGNTAANADPFVAGPDVNS